jgi:hypothetical protein
MKDVARMMEKVGIPGQDAYDLPSSTKTFPDGAHYRMEVSGVERPKVLEAVIDESRKRNIPIHRLISVVMGATLLDKAELKDFAQMAADACMERGALRRPLSRFQGAESDHHRHYDVH